MLVPKYPLHRLDQLMSVLAYKHYLRPVCLLLISHLGFINTSHAECSLSLTSKDACWYIGSGIGLSHNTVTEDLTNWETSSELNSAYQFFLGRSISDKTFIEVSFHDLGQSTLINQLDNRQENISHSVPSVKVGYKWLNILPNTQLLGSIGIAETNHEVNRHGSRIEQKRDTDLMLGIGVEWNINSKIFSRLDVTSFGSNADFMGIAIGTRFGEKPKKPVATIIPDKHNTSLLLPQETIQPPVCTPTKIWDNIYFAENSTSLSEIAQQYLLALSNLLRKKPEMKIAIHSHTDITGNEQYNLQLSQQRSSRIIQFMKQQGVPSHRLHPFAYGGERPLADNSTADGRAENRRAEFTQLTAECTTIN